ncbi:MAG: transglutaminase-like domain-containing protein [Desulfurococcaceae archaeon]
MLNEFIGSVRLKVIAVITALLLVSSFVPVGFINLQVSSSSSDLECRVLYFFNGIIVYNSTISTTLALETPGNISLVEGFEQTAVGLVAYNVVFNESVRMFTFNITEGEYFEGFYISELRICVKPQQLNLLQKALRNPMSSELPDERTIPQEILENYVKPPYSRVVEEVKPQFEDWFKKRYFLSVDRARYAGIAVTAGYFVYQEFIKYDPASLPRTIDEVIETRRGDCDDMSRVLVELLNSYGIPALIAYGYVYIKNFNYTITLENVTYIFINNGPHGFTLSYIPGFGWLSLDFLAYSLIVYPFVFESYTRVTEVDKEAVEEVVQLHRKINATQVLGIFDESEVKQLIGYPITLDNALRFFNKLLKGYLDIQESQDETFTETFAETTHEIARESSEITSSVEIAHGEKPFPSYTIIALILVAATALIVTLLLAHLVKRK